MVSKTWEMITTSSSDKLTFPPGLDSYEDVSPLMASATKGDKKMDLMKKWKRIVTCYNTLCADFFDQQDLYVDC